MVLIYSRLRDGVQSFFLSQTSLSPFNPYFYTRYPLVENKDVRIVPIKLGFPNQHPNAGMRIRLPGSIVIQLKFLLTG
jgi:hypothetical protein